ncbi:hypothetical protein CDIK_2205 [Cucumispora dikerogammari]|nr:hypothetical protein CDIK_2205 [Cucumispora dikerogammari]
MSETHNNRFFKILLKLSTSRQLEIKITKEISRHDAFQTKHSDFSDFFKQKLDETKKKHKLSSLTETNILNFETAGILLRNENIFYLSDFETSRELVFEIPYLGTLYAGKIIVCGVQQDIENNNLLKYQYSIFPTNAHLKQPEIKINLDIQIWRGPLSLKDVETLNNIGDMFIFIGPFYDSNNNSDKANGYSILEEYNIVIKKIEEISENFKKKVVLLPSLEDIPPHNIFPQARLNINCGDNIILGSNPFEFSVEGVNFCYINNYELDIIQKTNKFTFGKENNDNINKLDCVMEEVFANNSCVNVFQGHVNYSVPEYLRHSGVAQFFLTSSSLKTTVYGKNGRNIVNLCNNTNLEKVMLKIQCDHVALSSLP